MNIEEEIFKRTHVDIKRLIEYGFKQEDDCYTFSKKFMNDNFRADIVFNIDGKIFGKVFDLETNEEYTNIRIKTKSGTFINNVCELYKDILKDIKNKCFNNDYFLSNQANRITNYVINEY